MLHFSNYGCGFHAKSLGERKIKLPCKEGSGGKKQTEARSKRAKENYTAPKPRRKITSDTQSDPIIVGDAPMPGAAPKRRTTRVTGQRHARDFFTVNSFDDSTYKRVSKTPLAPPRPVDARSPYGHGFWDEEFLV